MSTNERPPVRWRDVGLANERIARLKRDHGVSYLTMAWRKPHIGRIVYVAHVPGEANLYAWLAQTPDLTPLSAEETSRIELLAALRYDL